MCRFSNVMSSVTSNVFGNNSSIFIYSGSVYDIKDYLKEQGAKFNKTIGAWYSDKEISMDNLENIYTIKISTKDLLNEFGTLRNDAKILIKNRFKEKFNIGNVKGKSKPSNVKSNNPISSLGLNLQELCIGTLGEQVVVKVKCLDIKECDGKFDTFMIYTFKNRNNLMVQCFTKKKLCEVDEVIYITGKVKEYKIYQGSIETRLEKVSKIKIY